MDLLQGNQKTLFQPADLEWDTKKDNYTKVITEPLVRSEDCQYIVAGEIKFFDDKDTWLATFDYGDGTCDDWVTKYTNDGTNTFSLNDYPEFN